MKGFGRWNSGTVFALQWPDGSLKTSPLEPSKLLKKSRLEVRVTSTAKRHILSSHV